MTVHVRLTSALYKDIRADLERPHEFAAERVGFAYGRQALTSSGVLVIVIAFDPVADSDYEDDPSVGARIGAPAINKALQRAASLGAAAFHVHAHLHAGPPRFSRTDLAQLPPVMEPFAHIVSNQTRGLLVFSDDDCTGLAWVPGERSSRRVSAVTVVGSPMQLIGVRR
ncbi:MAG TPA: hypothetical protein VKT78_10320 [Fimbriimonadaceae bacterium]|nr:hypothetical protein [Fimbriimonadaceae bacterium]